MRIERILSLAVLLTAAFITFLFWGERDDVPTRPTRFTVTHHLPDGSTRAYHTDGSPIDSGSVVTIITPAGDEVRIGGSITIIRSR